jgi:hypothetical protein
MLEVIRLVERTVTLPRIKWIYLHSTPETSVNKVRLFYVTNVAIAAKEFDITSKKYAILKSELSQWKQNDKRSTF